VIAKHVKELEAAVDRGVDDALGIMQHLSEQNASAYCEAEEVLAKPPSAECMPSPPPCYQTRADANQNAHDCKENIRGGSDNVDGGTSSFVNWLSVSLPLHF
jgi:hypothetical protein